MYNRGSELNYHKPNVRSMQNHEKMKHNTVISSDVRDRETGRCEISAYQKVIVSRAVQVTEVT